MSDPDCIFCKVVRRELPSEIVFENDELIAFNDIGAQAPTHLLIIPKTHIATLNDLGAEHADLVGRMVLKARDLAAERGIDDDGYRLVANCNAHGGQTVYHIHLHLLGGRQLKALG
ncbi:MAG: histidine triad nucleotide-binding protein [Pseudomonadales bacterium]|jgi:histidine triad (HIT) family protein|nr:histidine triad nucleotide-binding protein [Pseudomonadales bacterium]MDP6470760.1 histidine triad nucleotide-binding protein [Pseudomonadales bacterium]MDP6828288.1 histidine triad nucleotide-binding protein [Pseudomonadales bacterium]MDP6970425.1 histidine triad nucleotide-binding protein [Pseudomonadales bacterium]|tara:strand:+ start:519 stop:866 length:348 start_codon:yes stop_codon:yes gene_type:complete